MYVPPHFAEADPAVLHAFIRRHSFGLLVSTAGDEPFASHLPFLLDADAGPHGTLVCHVARANPQWRGLGGRPVLAVFSGPHAYVSPSWYAEPDVVPTWNYAAVHAAGRAEVVENAAELLDIVRRSVDGYEAGFPEPWQLDTASPHVGRLLGGIVGLRVRIDRLDGKWKLSQNHPPGRREKVMRALRGQGGEDAVGVAELMAACALPSGGREPSEATTRGAHAPRTGDPKPPTGG